MLRFRFAGRSIDLRAPLAATVFALLAHGCFSGLPADGAVKCNPNPARPCPKLMYCALDGTCWRSGHAPAQPDLGGDLGGAVTDDAGPTDDASPTGSDGGGTLLATGSPCTDGTACNTGHCVDGVCCEDACAGLCQACDVDGMVGICTALTSGQPHGARPSCSTSDPTCGGGCSAASATQCSYPDNKTACGAACDGFCDGAGSCSSMSTGSCPGGFSCGQGGCRTACTVDGDCLPNFRCAAPACMRVPEADCLDGKDNNGDGLADCQDPTCSARVTCVPSVPVGEQLGLMLGGACPTDYTTALPEGQVPAIPSCTGCSCTPHLSCQTTVSFSSTGGCGSASLVATFTSAPFDSPCQALSAVSTPNSIAVAVTPVGPPASCELVKSTPDAPTVDAPHYGINQTFCAANRSSNTCADASQVCVAQPPAPLCVRIGALDAPACPTGYTATKQDWYGGFQSNLSCPPCGCTQNDSGSCAPTDVNGALVLGGPASCPISGFNGTAFGTTYGYCADWTASSSFVGANTPIGAIQLLGSSTNPSCTLNLTTNGTATPINGATICCSACSCTAPPCLSPLCNSGNFCDGTNCQTCNSAKMCGTSCLDCTTRKADTCTTGLCKCGALVCTNRADACTTGVCTCGGSGQCALGHTCIAGFCH